MNLWHDVRIGSAVAAAEKDDDDVEKERRRLKLT